MAVLTEPVRGRVDPSTAPTRRAVRIAAGAAVVLAVSAAMVWWLLPSDASVGHWSLAWTGLDVGLAVLALVTAVLLSRGDPRAVLGATAGAALLVCDAWFDVTTASTTASTWLAVGEAVLVELPLAALALRLAAQLLRPARPPGL